MMDEANIKGEITEEEAKSSVAKEIGHIIDSAGNLWSFEHIVAQQDDEFEDY